MFFVEGDRKFFARGVSYGPFSPTQLGEPFPEKECVERDFALMHELGANTIRVYHVPPGWLCELAAHFGLRLLVGIPWAQHVRFLDSRSEREEIRRRVREGVRSLCHAPNVLAFLVGNEIPPDVVRWYEAPRVERFLQTLADEVKQIDPEALVSYANFPMTEYLDVDRLDFVSFNVYLHRIEDLRRYLSRLQNLAGPRPLVLTEFGIDSLREGEDRQATLVARSAREAARLGCAGTIVFAHTDEWHTGGFDIEDWAFGLVTRDRRPKPAFEAVQRVYRSEVPELPDAAPRVSVIVCAYNAERTLEECLHSLRRIRYPDFEVIVVDDGSTDSTRAIAEQFPEFRLISHENRGLSAARNDGIRAARGAIVAFTDADCAVDPDWLALLVDRLTSGTFAGVGGPNLPPPEDDHWVADVVARSPGGPTHVLLGDWEAEHVPGCNMAFWRDSLLEVGLFDPIFRTAGDDVDVCWRLQDAGHAIGFAAAALVWHRRRHTVRAYLAQQAGYGRAEAMLHFKHPRRFNGLGHSRWAGRIYGGSSGRGLLGARGVVYGGPFGRALFQTLYAAPRPLLRHLPATLEWHATALGLLLLGALSYAARAPVPILLCAGLALLSLSVAQAVDAALRWDRRDLPAVRSRLLLAALSALGPLVRGFERFSWRVRGLSQAAPVRPEGARRRPGLDWLRRRLVLSYWNETSIEKETCLSALGDVLRRCGLHVVSDDGWRAWDLLLHRGLWTRGEIKTLVENHGAQKRRIVVGMRLRRTVPARLVTGALGLAASVSAGVGPPWAVGLLVLGLLGTEGYLRCELYRLARTFRDAVEVAFRPLPVVALGERRRRAGATRTPERSLPPRAPVAPAT
jgi:glycosyltransferase involved in cell wall biosynthesis